MTNNRVKPGDDLYDYIIRRIRQEAVTTGRFLPLTGDAARIELPTFVDDEVARRGVVLSQGERRHLIDRLTADHSPLSLPSWLIACLEDSRIEEILIVGPARILVRQGSELSPLPSQFENDLHLLYVLNSLLSRTGCRLNDREPAVFARFPDGSEMAAIMSPLGGEEIFVSLRINRSS